MAETENKAAQIAAFLNNGSWQIAPDREQTRRALVDCLAVMPAELVRLLFTANRLLVVAPPAEKDATTYAFRFQASGEGVETLVVFLDRRLESYEYEAVLPIVRQRLAAACARLAGLDHARAEQVGQMETERKPS
ncbi:MAG TPA: hypothetical protein VKV17_17860 [Bryobacteraceae bacterium]|nr:hypothetical protein [Bryobacteraceae bacterium]